MLSSGNSFFVSESVQRVGALLVDIGLERRAGGITSDDDLKDAMRRVSDYNRERAGETPKIVPLRATSEAERS